MDWNRFIRELKKIYLELRLDLRTVARSANVQLHILSAIFDNNKTMTIYVLKKLLWHFQKVNKDTATKVFGVLLECGFNPLTVKTYCKKLKVTFPDKLNDMLTNRKKKKETPVVITPVVENLEKRIKERRMEYKKFIACNFVEGTE